MLRIHTSPAFKAEKTYAFSVLLGELLGIPFEIRHPAGAQHYWIELPDGKKITIEDHFFGQNSEAGYLKMENIPAKPVHVPHPFDTGAEITAIYGRAFFSSDTTTITCGLDLFASAFFMLTRWEEYVRPERDQYGRFPAAASLAMRGGFLQRPVVNEYAELLWQMLVRLGWNQPRPERRFRLHLSHDVDHPLLWWSVTDRLRTLAGSLFHRKNVRETAWWLFRHTFRRRDPNDIFDYWMAFSEQQGITAHFNFLGDRPAGSDAYYPLDHPFVRNLIRKVADHGHVIGFHPSREAAADPAVFDHELDSLRRLSPVPVTTGRQHYLCFEAPHTWQRWADAGMDWDSTAGYPDAEGFRCGICCSFPVFNFLTRQALPLREKPLVAMDVTLAQYRKYPPYMAFEQLQNLRYEVEAHSGEYVLLWHNSSWNSYFWAPYRNVYLDFVKSCGA